MRLVVIGIATLSILAGAPPGRAERSNSAEDQMGFGAQMAARGLWAEARFRFERADRLRPNDAHTLSNLAVASEALGDFEGALDYYRRALEIRSSDREIRGNYDRFLGFYEAYQARKEQAASDEPTPEESVEGAAAETEAPAETSTAPAPPSPDEAAATTTTDTGEGRP